MSSIDFFNHSFSTLTLNIFVCIIHYLMKLYVVKMHLKLNPYIYFTSNII